MLLVTSTLSEPSCDKPREEFALNSASRALNPSFFLHTDGVKLEDHRDTEAKKSATIRPVFGTLARPVYRKKQDKEKLMKKVISDAGCPSCGHTFTCSSDKSPLLSGAFNLHEIEVESEAVKQVFGMGQGESILWALLFFPVGFLKLRQKFKWIIWVSIIYYTSGFGIFLMWLDYFMCNAKARKTGYLNEWSFFPVFDIWSPKLN